ncbi:MAG: hypothetical protein COT24_00545 [Candidatus Kerfeldbacteria bacterium CG08_land_8_20_14_0_20_40_16]|uniref:Uncharacterized protein n=1 Tax=Candidatus Kerfeldbacteria bacterium CG08_land_8_20_14_0_20_40_16 TaxID=2014244 RepID=A0A2H0YWZ4_9BACT|nr:MAG: hypothetical protein COT24_00545 [Candidatus Kerfeldbacteria bacterium CG08_land_8_20_14_0_20_40_16]
MPKKLYPKILGFGLLLFVATMLLLFIMSIVTGSEQPVDYPWVGVVVAVIMTFCSLWFSRLLPMESAKQALRVGIIWALMLIAILLIIAIPNKTTSIVFGQWSMYLVFVGVAVGPILLKRKPAASSNINNQQRQVSGH